MVTSYRRHRCRSSRCSSANWEEGRGKPAAPDGRTSWSRSLMKLGYWTLGMPAWTSDELADVAVRYGFDGIEINSSRRLAAPEGFELPLEPSDAEVAQVKH